jgi:ATP-dependent DNA helicase RecG
LIDESDALVEVKSVIKEFEYLNEGPFKGLKIGLLHGRMSSVQKDEVMSAFKDGNIDVLVSTSVIEVGIDVSNATIMMIEGAERFGLSQLHQFRGRVGRSDKQSYCFLKTSKYTPEGMNRLSALERTHDGFELAEIDLKLRGPGEIYGTRQSGIPDLKVASFADSELIKLSRDMAIRFVNGK